MLLTALAALALCAPARGATQGELDAVASRIAGAPVRVACAQTYADYEAWNGMGPFFARVFLGYTDLREPVVYLSPRACLPLLAGWADPDFGRGVLVLTHESVHQRGVANERWTECTALPLVTTTAEWLGTPWQAMGAVYAGAKAQHDALSREYRVGRCPRQLPS